jgi:hypothetical protein
MTLELLRETEINPVNEFVRTKVDDWGLTGCPFSEFVRASGHGCGPTA